MVVICIVKIRARVHGAGVTRWWNKSRPSTGRPTAAQLRLSYTSCRTIEWQVGRYSARIEMSSPDTSPHLRLLLFSPFPTQYGRFFSKH